MEKPASPRMPSRWGWLLSHHFRPTETVVFGTGFDELVALVQVTYVAGAAGDEGHRAAAMEGSQVPHR